MPKLNTAVSPEYRELCALFDSFFSFYVKHSNALAAQLQDRESRVDAFRSGDGLVVVLKADSSGRILIEGRQES